LASLVRAKWNVNLAYADPATLLNTEQDSASQIWLQYRLNPGNLAVVNAVMEAHLWSAPKFPERSNSAQPIRSIAMQGHLNRLRATCKATTILRQQS